jgi:hypothetical protein
MANDFKIKITNEVDTAGTEAEEDELKKLAEQAEDAHRKILDGQEKIEISHREMRESLGAVGRAFGGLADVGLWLSPVTAALAAVLAAVNFLKEHFEALNQRIREYIDTSRQIRSDHMDAVAAATREAADAMANYARQARAAVEAQNADNQAMQDRLALNDAYMDSLKKIAEAQEKAAEAQIEHDVQSGRITQQEGERRKDIARERLQWNTANLSVQQEQQRIAEHQRQLDEANARIPAEQAARDAAVAAAEHPSVTAADTKKEIDRQSKILTEQNKKVADSLAEAEQHRTPGTFAHGVDNTADLVAGKPLGTMAKASAEAAERRAAQDQKLADATAAYIRSLQAKQDASDRAVKDAKAEADIQNEKLEKDQEIVRTAPDRIAQEKALLDRQRQTADAVNHWNQQANVTREGDTRSPADAASQTQWGQTPAWSIGIDADAGRAAIANARGAVQSGHGNAQELQDLFNEFMGLARDIHASAAQRSDLANLTQEVAELRQQMHVNRYGQ